MRKNFNLLLLSKVLSRLGDNMFYPALVWYATHYFDNSVLGTSIVTFIYFISVIFQVPVGSFVDRNSRRKILINTSCISFILCLVLSLSIKYNLGFLSVVLIFMLLQFVAEFIHISTFAIVPSIVTKEYMPTAQAKISLFDTLSKIGGILLGGITSHIFSFTAVCVINALSFIASGLLIYFINIEEEVLEEKEIKDNYVVESILTVKSIFKNRALKNLVFSGMFLGLPFSALTISITLIVNDILNLTSFHYSVALIALSLGGIFGSYLYKFVDEEKHDVVSYVSKSFIILSVPFLILAFYINYPILLVAIFFMDVIACLIDIRTSVWLQSTLDSKYLGRMDAVTSSSVQVSQALGILIFTWVIESFGLSSYYVISSICLILAALIWSKVNIEDTTLESFEM